MFTSSAQKISAWTSEWLEITLFRRSSNQKPPWENRRKQPSRPLLHLYPIFKSVKWISYYSGPSGSDATYFTDKYFTDGIGPRSLPGKTDMTCNDNYRFIGW